MRFLRSNTAVIVTVGPFYDKTDGVTIETALTITNEKITLTADTDAGSAPTNILDNITGATSATANDLNYITGNDAGMMQLELAAADTNRVGRMFLSITDAANHVPVFHEFFVLPQAIYDWLTGVIVPLPANVTQLLGTAWLTPGTAGTPDVNAKLIGGTSQTGRDIGASVLLSTGTGTGQLDFTSGVVKANLAQILGTALTETAGLLAGGFKKFFNIASPVSTMDVIATVTTATTATNLTNAPTAGDLTATMKTSVTTAATAATPIAASVTGAVGSVAAGGITASSIAADAIGASELAADAVTEIRSLASGTSDSGTTTTMVDAARTEADTDYWAGSLIVFTSGNIAGQARYITGFTPASDTITFTPATTQAVATQTYEIWPSGDYLRPTTSGRTLDVSTGGEAGLDWANIGSPTTAQNLSATNIDVDQIVASVSGAVGSIASGGITTASFAAGAINAAAIATDAIGAAELAADAVTEIAAAITIPSAATVAAAVWDLDATGHQTQGTFGQAIGDPVADTNTIYKAVVTDAAGANVAADIVAVKADTAEIGTAGAGLTAINLPNQTMDIVGNITGNLSGSVGSVTGNVGGNVTGSIGSLAAQAKTDVNAEVVDVIATDTYAEPGQATPAATTTLATKLNYLYKSWRNKKDNDGSTTNLYADNTTTIDQKQTTSESGGTVTKGEWGTGP